MTMHIPSVDDLPGIIDTVASWQREGLSVQVHPGDLGWYQRFGANALASALRVWTHDGEPAAVGFLDESELIRMAISPGHAEDTTLAEAVVTDLETVLSDLLPSGTGIVEARFGSALQHALTKAGWTYDEPWTVLHRDLADPVPPTSLRFVAVEADRVDDRVSVEASAFRGSSLTVERWMSMAGGHAYQQARCLVGYCADGAAVGAATVWSAGHGRPGIVEPLGVHSEHRGYGFGTGMALGAASVLRDMGASSITVATPSSNDAAVAAYRAAGMDSLGEVRDYLRPVRRR